MRTFPDFGGELKRPFEVDARCFDCVELYGGCPARREDPDTFCPDYLRLPDVLPGSAGQTFPPSRLRGQQPRPPRPGPAARLQVEAQPKNPPTGRPPEQIRQQSPAATPGTDGERLCGCGAPLRKRERCCGACRLSRRQETMLRRRSGERPSLVVVQSDPGVPLSATGTLSTQRRRAAHN